jgi:ATP-dependent Lon protease
MNLFLIKIKLKMNEWKLGVSYKKGDIVFKYIYDNLGLIETQTYYKCNINHISDFLVGPWSNEEMYWTKIDDQLPKEHSLPIKVVKKRILKINTKKFDKIQQEIQQEIKVEETERIELKRKIKNVEDELENYNKKQKMEGSIKLTIEERILLLDVDISTKSFLIDKYTALKDARDSDYSKGITWLKTVVDLPFNNYKNYKIKNTDNKVKINEFFTHIRKKLDNVVYGLDETKEEILEFLAKKITNPNSKGHILALHGNAGTGKTKILHTLAEALDLPFNQINFGGINDGSILTGHSETYVGSKPGKIVEMLTKSGCMNAIFYLDEIDKIANHKNKEINGILTHLLDEEQNDKFQDNYLSNINIDLSKVFFVISFNDITKVNPIVLDRMRVIKIKNPSMKDKLIIAQDKLIPQIKSQLNKDLPDLTKDIIHYILYNKVQKEDGVRQLKKTLEKIFNKLNYMTLLGKDVVLNTSFIDQVLKTETDDTNYKMMYI